MLDFGVKSRIPCKMLGPIPEELHQEYNAATIVFVNVGYHLDLARRYQILGMLDSWISNVLSNN